MDPSNAKNSNQLTRRIFLKTTALLGVLPIFYCGNNSIACDYKSDSNDRHTEPARTYAFCLIKENDFFEVKKDGSKIISNSISGILADETTYDPDMKNIKYTSGRASLYIDKYNKSSDFTKSKNDFYIIPLLNKSDTPKKIFTLAYNNVIIHFDESNNFTVIKNGLNLIKNIRRKVRADKVVITANIDNIKNKKIILESDNIKSTINTDNPFYTISIK